MGQFILFLLGLFAIGCVFYGISAGVQMIQRGFAYVAESASDKQPLPTPRPPNTGETADRPTTPQEATRPAAKASAPAADASPIQRRIDELREIFMLYQQGALTQEEFGSMPFCVELDNLKDTDAPIHQPAAMLVAAD